MVRPRCRQPVHAARRGRCREAARRHDRRGERAVRDRPPQCPALLDPRGDARRLLGTRANCPSRHQPAVSRTAHAIQGVDGLPGSRQYVVQRARRADRRDARRRLSLLHGDRHRGARRRQLPARQGSAGQRTARPLRNEVCAGQPLGIWRAHLFRFPIPCRNP